MKYTIRSVGTHSIRKPHRIALQESAKLQMPRAVAVIHGPEGFVVPQSLMTYRIHAPGLGGAAGVGAAADGGGGVAGGVVGAGAEVDGALAVGGVFVAFDEGALPIHEADHVEVGVVLGVVVVRVVVGVERVKLLVADDVAVVGDLDELVDVHLPPDVLLDDLLGAVAGFEQPPGCVVVEVVGAVEVGQVFDALDGAAVRAVVLHPGDGVRGREITTSGFAVGLVDLDESVPGVVGVVVDAVPGEVARRVVGFEVVGIDDLGIAAAIEGEVVFVGDGFEFLLAVIMHQRVYPALCILGR